VFSLGERMLSIIAVSRTIRSCSSEIRQGIGKNDLYFYPLEAKEDSSSPGGRKRETKLVRACAFHVEATTPYSIRSLSFWQPDFDSKARVFAVRASSHSNVLP
jgi:hypothetical protein